MKSKSVKLAALMTSFALLICGCSPIVAPEPESLRIYASFYPIYALSEMIVREVPNLELHCLVQPQDGCLRNYALSDWDLYLLSYSADGILLGGRGLESFADGFAKVEESGWAVAEVLSGLELFAGDPEQEDEAFAHWSGENPHLYLSLDGAEVILKNISTAMSLMDPRYEAEYAHNLKDALSEITVLRKEIQPVVQMSTGRRTAILNEALEYVAQDYDLEIAARIPRESGENVAASELPQYLEILREQRIELVLVELQAPLPLINALESAGFIIAKIDILSTHQESEGAQGYLDAMRFNAQSIQKACTGELQ